MTDAPETHWHFFHEYRRADLPRPEDVAEIDRLRAALRKARASIFYPQDRTGYETPEELAEKVAATIAGAQISYPNTNGDHVTALAYACMQHQSVIAGAKQRWADTQSAITAALKGGEPCRATVIT